MFQDLKISDNKNKTVETLKKNNQGYGISKHFTRISYSCIYKIHNDLKTLLLVMPKPSNCLHLGGYLGCSEVLILFSSRLKTKFSHHDLICCHLCFLGRNFDAQI